MHVSGDERPIFRLEQKLAANWRNFHACEEATQAALESLREAVSHLATADTSIVVFGSLARRELTKDSDADWSLIVDGLSDPQHLNSSLEISRKIQDVGLKVPGREGVFGQLTFGHDLIHYIGGEDDTNTNTTRRILLLLESSPIGRREVYDRVLRNILDRYLSEDYGWVYGRNPKGVPRFLQNDISRFWRTMAVDFAYKQRQRAGEGWGLRSTKLRLSRKLLFASGLLYCFNCALDEEVSSLDVNSQGRTQAFIAYLWKLSQRSPLDTMADIFLRFEELHQAALEMFGAYDSFLGLLNDSEKRQHLESLSHSAAATDQTYESVRELGHAFQRGLDRLFMEENPSGVYELTKTYGVF
jgi:predicted nucleotidyltransferase